MKAVDKITKDGSPIIQREMRRWIADSFVRDAWASYQEFGAASFRVLFKEKPHEWMKVMMALFPEGDITPPDAVRVIVTGAPRRRDDELAQLPAPDVDDRD
jgi:hypothetical protein